MEDIKDIVLNKYQVRKSVKEKEDFQQCIKERYESMGYVVTLDKVKNNTNIIIGNIKEAKLILSAHYDTCAVLPFPNFVIPNSLIGYILSQLIIFLFMFLIPTIILTIVLELSGLPYYISNFVKWIFVFGLVWWTMYGKANKHTVNDNSSGVITVLKVLEKLPQELHNKVCVVLFDNEEKGLLGSKALVKKYPDIRNNKIILNYDCVSDGDHILFFPSKQMKNDEFNNLINDTYKLDETKHVRVNKGFGFYTSDNMVFKKSYGICALKKIGCFYYLNRIHTVKDIIYDEKNISLLVDGSLKVVEKIN